MIFDLDMIRNVYANLPQKIQHAKQVINRPLTLSEKILFAHLSPGVEVKEYKRASDYVDFAPDRVAMQDATAQMALLQLMNSGRTKVAVPSTVHCDHLIQAYKNAESDLETAMITNKEVYDFCATYPINTESDFGNREPGLFIRLCSKTMLPGRDDDRNRFPHA
jgi:aconitate hydratase